MVTSVVMSERFTLAESGTTLMALVNYPMAQVVPRSEEIGKLMQYACSHTMTIFPFRSVLANQKNHGEDSHTRGLSLGSFSVASQG